MFITDDDYDGDLVTASGQANGLAGADALCARAAVQSRLGGTWRAWLSDDSTNAIDRIVDVGPWFSLLGKKVYENVGAIGVTRNLPMVGTAGDAANPSVPGPSYEEGSVSLNFWTGSDPRGKRDPRTCQSWTTKASGVGISGYFDTVLSSDQKIPCGERMHLLCFEQTP